MLEKYDGYFDETLRGHLFVDNHFNPMVDELNAMRKELDTLAAEHAVLFKAVANMLEREIGEDAESVPDGNEKEEVPPKDNN